VLHYGAHGFDGLLECSAEGGFLPPAGVASYADSIEIGAQLREADAIVVLRRGGGTQRLAAASYQMIAMYANVHAGGDPVGLQKLGQLTLSGAHLLVHGSAYQGQAPVRPTEGVSFAAVPPRYELL